MTPARPNSVTIAEWLSARVPPVPPALDARMREALGAESLGANANDLPQRALDAAERLVRDVMAEVGEGDRRGAVYGAALSLLAADALVTYASAYHGGDLASLDERLRDGMRRLASLATLPVS